jgi:hypothetical protein
MRKIFYILITLAAIISFPAADIFADEILCTNGAVIKGKVVKITKEHIQFEITAESDDKEKPVGSQWLLERSLAEEIIYSDGRRIVLKPRPESEIKPIEKAETDKADKNRREYFLAGASIGYPAGLNLHLGYYGKTFGLHESGLYFQDYMSSHYGFQGNLVWKLSESDTTIHGAALIAGFSNMFNDEPDDFRTVYHAGLAYNFYFHGFFLELGLAGTTVKDTMLGIIQLGYVHMFR